MTDYVTVVLSGDQYKTDADQAWARARVWFEDTNYTVYVQASGPNQGQAFTWPVDFKRTPKQVTIEFTNDLWGGAADKDRNLYVLGVTVGAKFYAPPASNKLGGNGNSITMDLTPPTVAPTPVPPAPAPTPTPTPSTPITTDTSPAPPTSKSILVPATSVGSPQRAIADGPLGMSASVKSVVMDATFGKFRSDATVKSHSDLFWTPKSIAYPFYIYNNYANQNPNRIVANGVKEYGPEGDGCNGLYGGYGARHYHYDEGTPQNVHRIDAEGLALRAWTGRHNGVATDYYDQNTVGAMLRYIPKMYKGMFFESRMRVPKNPLLWPAFWLNPGSQDPWIDMNTPGARQHIDWNAELDIFDLYAPNKARKTNYIVMGGPTGYDSDWDNGPGKDPGRTRPQSDHAVTGYDSQGYTPDLAPTFQDTSVTYWNRNTGKDDGWYAQTKFNLEDDWHTFGAHWGKDDVWTMTLDGVVYRKKGYRWATPDATNEPAHLITSLQPMCWFQNRDGYTCTGGVECEWLIDYVRVWDMA